MRWTRSFLASSSAGTPRIRSNPYYHSNQPRSKRIEIPANANLFDADAATPDTRRCAPLGKSFTGRRSTSLRNAFSRPHLLRIVRIPHLFSLSTLSQITRRPNTPLAISNVISVFDSNFLSTNYMSFIVIAIFLYQCTRNVGNFFRFVCFDRCIRSSI